MDSNYYLLGISHLITLLHMYLRMKYFVINVCYSTTIIEGDTFSTVVTSYRNVHAYHMYYSNNIMEFD